MIVFDLRCPHGHCFEAWFRDGGAFEDQQAEGSLRCPICGDSDISKAIMAPAVSTAPRQVPGPEQAAQMMKALRTFQDHVERNFDHVGTQFAEEARKIHYGETDKRNIYGDATAEDAKALRDEGIEVGQMPWLPKLDD